MAKTISIRVEGKVQGVFYRQSTREKASELGLTGLVKNLPDESVEIIATGNETELGQLVDWCRTGPPAAIVTSVKINELPLQSFDKFRVQRN